MRVEIERKFRVAHDGWRAAATGCRILKDGLVGQLERGKVRVRLEADRAWLTVKGARSCLAEVELAHEAQDFDRPDWLGAEVTGDLRFRQTALLHLCGQPDGQRALADLLSIDPARQAMSRRAQAMAPPPFRVTATIAGRGGMSGRKSGQRVEG
ncbi:hypothetical protein [Methylobacterium oxalidis]|uniref:Uncharacterized protein n=1 Tax=Methylobacterium oxalidis TaxID=944322 RepID=A0A512J5X2_9HYPH|nr:hypothetical protein MOX02_34140 [Methylobacterium oxalidis]GJE30352.1 hypothetical protein LDDCCGHA_0519 [Methylobacterium oxalidis]GLS66266.1 hypothetical protein GCM10007888_46480 [Methylobacterium oxalidis]